MKLICHLVEVLPNTDYITVYFEKDPHKTLHEIYFKDFQPWDHRMRKMDTYEFTIKWESIKNIVDDHVRYTTVLVGTNPKFISGIH